jgi:hypothetical protein
MIRKPDNVKLQYIVLALAAWWLFWIGWIVVRRGRKSHSAA